MTVNRRTTLKLGLTAGLLPLMGTTPSTAGVTAGTIGGARTACTPLPLNAVRLTGGPLKNAQELDAEYLMALEPECSRITANAWVSSRAPSRMVAGMAAGAISPGTLRGTTCPP